MTVWGIVGNLGYGKTLHATYYAKKFEAQGKDVYSNITIVPNPRSHRQHKIGSEALESLFALKQSLLVLDEAYEWLESRYSSSIVNRTLSHGVLQSRKRGLDIIHTAQLASTIDLRLRRVTTTLIWALKPTDDGFNYVYFAPDGTYHYSLDMTLAQKLFKFFDTKEIVAELEDEEIEEPVKKRGRMTSKQTSDAIQYLARKVTELEEDFRDTQTKYTGNIKVLDRSLTEHEKRIQKQMKVFAQEIKVMKRKI